MEEIKAFRLSAVVLEYASPHPELREYGRPEGGRVPHESHTSFWHQFLSIDSRQSRLGMSPPDI
jgi:hypothetical protein